MNEISVRQLQNLYELIALVGKIEDRCFLIVKHGSGKVKVEKEAKISRKQFSSLWSNGNLDSH